MAETPDTIIGVGGAGKAVMYKMMEQDWILSEAMEDEGVLQAYAVDTDTGVSGDDEEKVEDLRRNISKLKEEYSQEAPRPDINYINIIKDTNPKYVKAEELINSNTVNDIADQSGLSCWWLRDNGTMLKMGSDYSGGVVRRRGLAKALYHANQTGSSDIDNMIGSADNGEGKVCMIVGLGGGTGSGLFIDIAKKIYNNSNADITLFGVLPRMDENENECANAHAALSELEYMSIQGSMPDREREFEREEDFENPFYNMVLVPFGGRQHEDEFEEAMAYTIMSYYNINAKPGEFGNRTVYLDEANGDYGPPPYAPFTMAVPQILRYSARDIDKAKEDFEDLLEELKESVNAESKLHDELEQRVKDYDEDLYRDVIENPQASEQGPSLDNETITQLIDKRIEWVNRVLDIDALEHFGFEEPVRQINEQIEYIEQDLALDDEEKSGIGREEAIARENRKIVNRLPQAGESQEGFYKPPGGYERDDHELFADLIQEEMRNIGRRRDLFRACKAINDEYIREGIETALDIKESGLTSKVNDKIAALKKDISSVENERDHLQRFQREAEEIKETKIDDWRSRTEDDFKELIGVDENISEVENLLGDLKTALQKEKDKTISAERASQLDLDFPFDRFDEINEKLDEAGADTLDASSIRNSVRNMKEARRVWIEATGGVSFTDRLKSFFGYDPFEALEGEYYAYKSEIDDDVIEISEWDEVNFSCEVKDQALVDKKIESLRGRESEAIDSIVTALKEISVNPNVSVEEVLSEAGIDDDEVFAEISFGASEENAEELRDWLEKQDLSGESVESVQDSLCSDSGEVSRAFNDAFIDSVSAAIDEKTEDISSRKEEVESYESLKNTIDSQSRTFANLRNDVTDPEKIRIGAYSGDKGKYIKEETATARGRLQNKKDIDDAALQSYDEEVNKYLRILKNDFASKVTNLSGFLPLNTGNISDKGRDYEQGTYENHRVFPVYMSRMFDGYDQKATMAANDDDDDKIKQKLIQSIYADEDEKHYLASKVESGGPWDLSMTVFVGGVFLDNINWVTKPNGGYKSSYESNQQDNGENIVVRHTHGVDGKDEYIRKKTASDGGYTYRSRVLNPNQASEVQKILDMSEKETMKEIMKDIAIEGITSTVPIER
jgi:hypothetical protein